jgi:hypothetical protein
LTRRRNPNNLAAPTPELRPEPQRLRDPLPFTERLLIFARALRRWSIRALLAGALLNFGYDLWAFYDQTTARDERRFFRGAERSGSVEYGVAEVAITNEINQQFLIDGFELDSWGGAMTHRPDDRRALSAFDHPGSVRTERRYIDHLASDGTLFLRDRWTGAQRDIKFRVDRRRPVSCRVTLRIQEDGADVSGCQLLRRLPPSFLWRFARRQD